MRTFILIDIYNMFFRAMHTINTGDSLDLQSGLLLHNMFFMIKKACDKFNPSHLVVCTDGNGSWRKDLYSGYKMNRLEKLQERLPSDVIREEHLKNVFTTDFLPFLKDKTNVSFLESPKAEADDLIARFIKLHPNDSIIILSTDNDFVQLISDNVLIYNSMEDRIITNKCMISSINHQPIKFTLKDGKVSVSKSDYIFNKNETNLTPMKDWIDYALFMKCIRGDKSDNIFSSYPGVREKSTKKAIGILDAFNDRKEKGYNWQSFMNSTWETPLGEKKIVKECYEFNKKIIDLNEIPDELKIQFDKDIMQSIKTESVGSVGFNIAKYLNKWNLERLSENIQNFSGYFSRLYTKG
jgi:5'-3' exonuclease